MKPPRYLEPGDVIEMGIDGLGAQKSRIVTREMSARATA
jgi:2-keto-4-pentenoate hydratase/2-oxohepta-3-ene-1,7-dioic acid hydratase in catechol pathway